MSWLNLLSSLAFLAVLGGLLIAVRRLDPHWASRDGLRFIATGEQVDAHGLPEGPRGEYRFSIELDGTVGALRRVMIGYRPKTRWRVEARSDDPPPRREIFVLRSLERPGVVMAVRLPATSRAVDTLSALLGDDQTVTDPDGGTW